MFKPPLKQTNKKKLERIWGRALQIIHQFKDLLLKS